MLPTIVDSGYVDAGAASSTNGEATSHEDDYDDGDDGDGDDGDGDCEEADAGGRGRVRGRRGEGRPPAAGLFHAATKVSLVLNHKQSEEVRRG